MPSVVKHHLQKLGKHLGSLQGLPHVVIRTSLQIMLVVRTQVFRIKRISSRFETACMQGDQFTFAVYPDQGTCKNYFDI